MIVVGFEPTPLQRLVPETSTLDHSATLSLYYIIINSPIYLLSLYLSERLRHKIIMIVVGFEPTPLQRLVPETSALDHSATLSLCYIIINSSVYLVSLQWSWRLSYKIIMIVVGFEPTPLKRLVPETSALDHSAHGPRFRKIYGVRGINLSSGSVLCESAH